MLVAWLLWIFCVAGGFYMGGAALLALGDGFDAVVAASAALYLGVGVYGLPRLLRLVRSRS
jgi:hypothetical protein